MSGNDYLAEYQRINSVPLSRGVKGRLRGLLDRKARRDGQDDRHGLFMPRVLALSGLSLAQPITVLEIGCGNGWAISYRHPSIQYIAMDRGSLLKPELEKRGIAFHEVDVARETLPVDSGSVDLVMLNHLIEHIDESEHLLRELRRVLRPRGIVYIRTPNVLRVKFGFWDDFTHVKPFTPSGLDQLMHAFRFRRKFLLYSDHGRINLDFLTEGRLRRLLFCKLLGGKEIEAGYVLD